MLSGARRATFLIWLASVMNWMLTQTGEAPQCGGFDRLPAYAGLGTASTLSVISRITLRYPCAAPLELKLPLRNTGVVSRAAKTWKDPVVSSMV
jgi:hypothetical protein